MRSFELDIIDAKEWKEAQTDYYKNQIENKYNNYINNNKIPLKQLDKDIYVESFLRSCDYVFRLDEKYIAFSEYWVKSSNHNEPYDKFLDVNCGYSYTMANVSSDLVNYEWVTI